MGPIRNSRYDFQILLVGLVMGLLAAACTAERSANPRDNGRGANGNERASTSGAGRKDPSIQELRTIEGLKDSFNEDFGKARLVLLLSPT
jgi:hypothetical protein